MTTIADPPATDGRAAVAAVTLGIFALMTSELLPVGLLTPAATALEVSEGVAGLMVTAPGLVAAVAAPVLTTAAARVDRRVLLAALLALMAAANLACAAATHFGVVLAARLAVGVSVGGFWAVAGGLAARLVPERRVARATAVVFGGVSAASVLGVPAGTLLADVAGWRAAFAGAGALGAAAVVLLLVLVPPLPSRRAGDWRDAPRLLRGTPAVRAGAAITFLLVTAHFTAYTFVRPLLERVAEVDGRWIGPLLLAYGAAGMAGNFAAGAALTRDVPRTVLAIAVALAAVPPLFALAGTAPASGAVLVVLWGLAYGGVSVSLQTWMLRAAPDDAEAASSLLVMAFNLAIALGALAGGRVADAFPLTGVLWTAGLLALPAALVVLTTKRK